MVSAFFWIPVGESNLSEKTLKTVVVGLGHQSWDDHIPALLESDEFELTAVCDLNAETVSAASQKWGVHGSASLDELLEEHGKSIDVALVAVPHKDYLGIIQKLCAHNIDIIKEKPFATSFVEAVELAECVREHNVVLEMTLQRRHNPVFTSFAQLVRRIGTIHAIEARYVMNIKRLDEGWRASQLYAGGGALIDLGYHYVDLIVWYFGLPEHVNCQISTGNREDQEYDVEDTAFVQFDYNRSDSHENHLLGTLVVSRVYPRKDEGMRAFGTKGHVEVQRGAVSRSYDNGEKEERLERFGSWPSALVDQLEACAQSIRGGETRGTVSDDYLKHVAFVEAAYRSAKIGMPVKPQEIFDAMREKLVK